LYPSTDTGSLCCLVLFSSALCLVRLSPLSLFFFFHYPAPPNFHSFPYTTLFRSPVRGLRPRPGYLKPSAPGRQTQSPAGPAGRRSEEHTSELQSLTNLVCRLLLEKKKKQTTHTKPLDPTTSPLLTTILPPPAHPT